MSLFPRYSPRLWSAAPPAPVPFFFAPGQAFAAVDISGRPLGTARVVGDVGIYHPRECVSCIVVIGSRLYSGFFRFLPRAGFPDFSRVFCSSSPPPGLRDKIYFVFKYRALP